MKSLKIVMLIGLFIATAQFATAQLTDDNNISYNESNSGPNDSFLASTDPIKRNLNINLDKHLTADKTNTTVKIGSLSRSQINRFISKSTNTVYSTPKKLSDGTYSITAKQCNSYVGNVPVKEAVIIFDEMGIVSVKMSFEKQRSKQFVDAHLAKYGSPNNENTLDNFAWVMNGYVMEVLENNGNVSANYKKHTPQINFINEGVSPGLF